MAESDFTKTICKGLETFGCEIYPIIGGMLGKNGWPDRLVWSRYFSTFIEFKGPTTPIKTHQILVMRRLNRVRPGSAYLCIQARNCNDSSGVLLLPDGTHKGKYRDGTEVLRFETAEKLYEFLKKEGLHTSSSVLESNS